MMMSNSEIVRSYRHRAGTPQAQIQILAELNLAEKKEIEEILEAAGEEIPKKGKKKKKTKEEEGEEEMAREYEQIDTMQQPGGKQDIPEVLMDALFDALDRVEAEIKEYSEKLAAAEKKYKDVLNYMGWKPKEESENE